MSKQVSITPLFLLFLGKIISRNPEEISLRASDHVSLSESICSTKLSSEVSGVVFSMFRRFLLMLFITELREHCRCSSVPLLVFWSHSVSAMSARLSLVSSIAAVSPARDWSSSRKAMKGIL